MSAVISVRVEDDIKEEIERLGHNPSDYLRALLLRELRRDRSARAIEWLKKNRLPAGKQPSYHSIRQDRDSR